MHSDSESSASDSEPRSRARPQATFAGANLHARELSKRRTQPRPLQTPTTPITPVVPTTPIIAAHFYGGENVMEDLQLAAELGKTLLERNRELENNIKHQQAVIDDQALEIEYLSKQTAALREVNDSRLRIYEQLEISIQDLEKANQRLNAEGSADKKKIKGLLSTIEQLEVKVVDLQKSLEESKSNQQTQESRGRTHKRRSLLVNEEQLGRRSQSCETTTQTSNGPTAEETDLQDKVTALQSQLKEALQNRYKEHKRLEELEIELSCMVQENNLLLEQINVLRQKEYNVRSIDDEISSVDDTSSSRVCRKCLGDIDTESDSTMYDFPADLTDELAETVQEKMKNGGYAWNSQESLVSLRHYWDGINPGCNSLTSHANKVPPNHSILEELDAQYKILIEKYESLIQTREKQQLENQHWFESEHDQTIVDSGVDEVSGPMSIMTTSRPKAPEGNLMGSTKCQRCSTCTCDLKPTNGERPKSIMEELSEVETTSSGFSEGEGRIYSKGTQTTDLDKVIAQTPTQIEKCLNVAPLTDPFENRFQSTPEYKKLFHEIFTVLKKTVDENELTGVHEQIMDSLKNSMNDDDFREVFGRRSNSKGNIHEDLKMTSEIEDDENKDPNAESDRKQTPKKGDKKKRKETKKISQRLEENETKEPAVASVKNEPEKPKRPDTLEIQDLSRSSSRQSRRRKRKESKKANEGEVFDEIQKQEAQSLPTRDSYDQKQAENILIASKTCSENIESRESSKGAMEKKRIIPRCEHKQRKHKNKKHRHAQQAFIQQKPRETERKMPSATHQYYDPQSMWNRDSYQNSVPKISYPSVEVAKLRKLEMSYAEVLKSTFNKTSYTRRY